MRVYYVKGRQYLHFKFAQSFLMFELIEIPVVFSHISYRISCQTIKRNKKSAESIIKQIWLVLRIVKVWSRQTIKL